MQAACIYLFVAGVGASASESAGGRATLDINELFPSFHDADGAGTGATPAHAGPSVYRNISLDIEKLDISKLRRRMLDDMQPRLRDLEGALPGGGGGGGRGGAQSTAVDGRRLGIIWKPNEAFWVYQRGYKIMISQLQCDMMLQLIYMAKGQVTSVENNPSVNTVDTGYRAGYLGNKCRRIFNKIGRLLSFMRRWQYAIQTATGHIVLHHRSVRLHVDFLYYYWVLNNMDALYRERFGGKYSPSLPHGSEPTGGISLEDPLDTREMITAGIHTPD